MKIIKVLPFLFLFLYCNYLTAQNIWCGGTPGQETNWNVAKNWSENKVPDWTMDVIIPDVTTCSGYFPVIDCEVEPIPHLEIQSNSHLTILSTGRLIIDGVCTVNSGITLIGNLIVNGDLEFKNVSLDPIENLSGKPLIDQNLLTVIKQ